MNEPEPCVQCGEVETTTLVCPKCRASNVAERVDRSVYPTGEDQRETKEAIRTERIAWLKTFASTKGCRRCGESDKRFLMWEPIPTYDGPSMAVMINRCFSVKRFNHALKFHVVTCWNHYYGAIAPDALYPSKYIKR